MLGRFWRWLVGDLDVIDLFVVVGGVLIVVLVCMAVCGDIRRGCEIRAAADVDRAWVRAHCAVTQEDAPTFLDSWRVTLVCDTGLVITRDGRASEWGRP